MRFYEIGDSEIHLCRLSSIISGQNYGSWHFDQLSCYFRHIRTSPLVQTRQLSFYQFFSASCPRRHYLSCELSVTHLIIEGFCVDMEHLEAFIHALLRSGGSELVPIDLPRSVWIRWPLQCSEVEVQMQKFPVDLHRTNCVKECLDATSDPFVRDSTWKASNWSGSPTDLHCWLAITFASDFWICKVLN